MRFAMRHESRLGKVWGVVLGRFFEEPVGWFYFTWLPLYLQNYRHLALSQIGIQLTIPYLTLDAGKIGGGYISSLLIKRGWCLDRSRKTVLSVGVVCLASSLLAVAAGTPLGFIMLISIATFGHGCWATASQTVPGDLVADRWVGTVYGITACGGGLGAIIFMQATGKLVDISHSFNTPLILAGLLPMLGLAAFMLVTGKIEPLHLPDARAHDPLN